MRAQFLQCRDWIGINCNIDASLSCCTVGLLFVERFAQASCECNGVMWRIPPEMVGQRFPGVAYDVVLYPE